MSSTTTRVSLYKPAGGENVNVTTDLNNNLDKLDTNLNFRVVANATARNAISPFWAGLNVRETDTGKCYVSNGSAPISASWQEIVQTNVRTTDELLLGNLTRQQRTNATDSVWESKAAADAQARWFAKANGEMWWGPGNATQDTNLYRSAADTLKTDDNMVVGGNLTVTGNKINLGAAGSISNTTSSTTTVANSASETVVATYSIPANDMVAGAVYKLTAWGTASTNSVAPTLRFNARIGGVAGTQFATTNTFTCTASQTNRVWKVEIYYVCIATGASGTGFGNLHVLESQSIAGTTNPVSGMNTRMDGGATHTVDTTVSRDLVLSVAWNTANAANSLVCRGFSGTREA